MGFSRLVRNNSSFRRLLLGRVVTNVGDSLYYIAAIWLVYDLSGSTVLSGVAGFLITLPTAFQFLVGPLVDRLPLGRILVVTQLVSGVVVLIIPIAALLGVLNVWVVLAVMPVLAVVDQFVFPAENAALPRITDRNDLPTANSLFAIAYDGIDAVFNAVGGLLLSLVGAVSLFVIDSLTFFLAMVLFATVRIPGDTKDAGRSGDASIDDYWASLSAGFEYVRGSRLLGIIGADAIANFAIGLAIAVLPAFAASRGGPALYGGLVAALGIGVLLGSVAVSRLQHLPMGRLTITGLTVSGAAWLGAVYSPWLPGTVSLFALATIPLGVVFVLFQTMVQSVVPARLLGRVTSLVASGPALAIPLGSIVGGVVAERFGTTIGLALAGVSLLLVAGYYAGRTDLRRLPPVEAITARTLHLSE